MRSSGDIRKPYLTMRAREGKYHMISSCRLRKVSNVTGMKALMRVNVVPDNPSVTTPDRVRSHFVTQHKLTWAYAEYLILPSEAIREAVRYVCRGWLHVGSPRAAALRLSIKIF